MANPKKKTEYILFNVIFVTLNTFLNSLAIINGQRMLIHSVMRFEVIQNVTEEQLQYPTFQQT
jgi:hypothetical protein